jgi:hypothetical protein
MNDYTAEKLGEVFAFTKLTMDTLKRGHDAVLQCIKQVGFDDAMAKSEALKSQIETIAQRLDQAGTMHEYADKTLTKVTQARDNYIGDSWDDPAEVYEWLCFTAGAGSGHAAEVAGAGEAADCGKADIQSLAEGGSKG